MTTDPPRELGQKRDRERGWRAARRGHNSGRRWLTGLVHGASFAWTDMYVRCRRARRLVGTLRRRRPSRAVRVGRQTTLRSTSPCPALGFGNAVSQRIACPQEDNVLGQRISTAMPRKASRYREVALVVAI